MVAFIVTYKNFAMQISNIARITNDLKNLYWTIGKEPTNWENFDEEIEIESMQSAGGDRVKLIFSENMKEYFINSIVKELEKKRNIYAVEKI